MASFLEQINNQKKNGGIVSTTEKKPEVAPEQAKAAGTQPKATEQPKKVPESKASPAPQHAPASDRPTAADTTPHGIRATENESVVDTGYFKKRVMTIIIASVCIVALIIGGAVTIHQMRLVTVRDFTGRSIAEMRKWAAEYNLVLDERNEYGSASEGIVVEQDIGEGKKLSPKSVICVRVSAGVDPDEHIEVPALSDMSASEIREWINTNRLSATKITESYSADVEKGRVIRFEFSSVSVSESNFKRNDGLTIYVSKGPEVVKPSDLLTVPDFSPIPRDDADKADTGLAVTVKSVYDSTVPYGGFVRQSVAAGEKVEKQNNKITVYYSLGRPYMPSLTGKTEPELAEIFYDLNRSGAELKYETKYVSGNAAKGQVLSSSVYNEFVAVGTHVTVYVCHEDLSLVVPDFSELTREKAEKYSGSLNVTVHGVYDNSRAYGAFISQSVRAGQATGIDGVVDVYYSLGRPFLPSLAGRNESELAELFYELNLKGADITYDVNYITYDCEKGIVAFSSVYNKYVDVGAHVTIYVCGRNRSRVVPDFSRLTQAEAEAYEGDFNIQVSCVYSNIVAKTDYVGQSVTAGQELEDKSRVIIVYYSLGMPFLPKLTGHNTAELASIFYALNRDGANLTYQIGLVKDDTVPKGQIVSASEEDAYVRVGQRIIIKISG